MTIIACSALFACIYEFNTHDDEFGFLQIKDFLFYQQTRYYYAKPVGVAICKPNAFSFIKTLSDLRILLLLPL